MRPLFLVGYMGCGKSTLGRTVSRITGIPFIDLDLYIEGRYHRSVRDLYAEMGEDGFRTIERNMLWEVADFEDVIVACGGGTPCFFDNMDLMNAKGLTIFLDAPVEILFSRLKRGRMKRPLIASKSDDELLLFIRSALDARMPHYRRALHTFSSASLENEVEIETAACRFITMFNIPNIHSK